MKLLFLKIKLNTTFSFAQKYIGWTVTPIPAVIFTNQYRNGATATFSSSVLG